MKTILILLLAAVSATAKYRDPRFTESLVIPFGGFDLLLEQVFRAPTLDRDSIAELDTLTFALTSDLVGDFMGTAAPSRLTLKISEPVEVEIYEKITVGFFLSYWATCSYFPDYRLPTADTGWILLADTGDGFERVIPDGTVFHKPVMTPQDWAEAREVAEAHEPESLVVSEDVLQTDYLLRITAPDGTTREVVIEFLNRPSG